MKRITLALAGAAAVAVAAPASAANLLTNGSFETGNFSGWNVTTTGGGTAPVVIAYGQASGYPTGAFGEAIPKDPYFFTGSQDNAGNYAAYFSSDTANPHSITQTGTINFTAGQTYNLGFDYYVPLNGFNNPNDASLTFTATFNGQTFNLTNLTTGSATSNTPPATWLQFQTSITPTVSGTATVSFNYFAQGVTAADFVVDRVFVQTAVPEAATWGMMIVGFAAIGSVMRRRKTTVAFAA